MIETASVLTLDPADGVEPTGLVQAANGAWEMRFAEPVILADDWAAATLIDGRTVDVRRSECGLPCRCAGEFRWATPEGGAE